LEQKALKTSRVKEEGVAAGFWVEAAAAAREDSLPVPTGGPEPPSSAPGSRRDAALPRNGKH